MKVIDLLNKIANDEEVPENIKYCGVYFSFQHNCTEYISDNGTCLIRGVFGKHLNDEVEIVEEEKKIPEKLDVELLGQCDNWLRYGTTEEAIKDYELNPYIIDTITRNTLAFQHKINEIIDYLESKGDE